MEKLLLKPLLKKTPQVHCLIVICGGEELQL